MFLYPLLLFILCLATFGFYIVGLGLLTRKPAVDAKFVAAIFGAMFLASILVTVVLMRLECQMPGQWIDLSCVLDSLHHTFSQLGSTPNE